MAAPRRSVPPWVSAASRAAIETKSPPQPGDPRFTRVKNDFPAPRQNVTVWREGDLVYRLDTQSGAVSGFRYSQDRYIGLHNRLLERYVEKEGMDLSPALDRIEQEVGDNNLRAILMFVLGSVG